MINQVLKRKLMVLATKYLILADSSKKSYNSKINDIKGKISSIPLSATTATTALATIENKIPDISNLVKKADYHAKYQTSNLNILLHPIIINL